MKIKKYFSLIVAFVASLGIMAQQPVMPPQQTPPPGQPHKAGPKHERMTPELRTENWIAHMSTELSLTEDQKIKLRDLILKREQQRMADRQSNKGNKEGMKQAAHARHSIYEPQLKAILTAEQYAKLEQMRRDRREQHKAHQAGNAGAPPPPTPSTPPTPPQPIPVDDEVDEY